MTEGSPEWPGRFEVQEIPTRSIYLGPWGSALRWWWGPFILGENGDELS